MELLPTCPTRACLSFVLPGHRYCPTCEQLLQTRPAVELPRQLREPSEEDRPLREAA